MEVPEMEEGKSESHLTSPAAFVEGGIQEACDDSCSICLEAFCDSDPSTVTSCKHEFHLQCILEWCQRSSNCPMCWQAISLKDPTSQELLEAVEQERSFRFNLSRNSTIFRHPTLGDFELQHLPVGANDGGLEDRIIQHLAAAAAMGRTHHVGRREGSRVRSSAHSRPQFVVFSAHPNAPSAAAVSASDGSGAGEAEPAAISSASPSVPSGVETVHPMSTSGTSNVSNHQGTSVIYRSSSSQSYLQNQDRAGPSDFQTVSDSWKSRFNALSMRYRESFSKSTRGWKERLFNRSSSMSNLGSEIRREVPENNHSHDSISSTNVGDDESLAAAEENNPNRVENNLDDNNNTGAANGATAPSN